MSERETTGETRAADDVGVVRHEEEASIRSEGIEIGVVRARKDVETERVEHVVPRQVVAVHRPREGLVLHLLPDRLHVHLGQAAAGPHVGDGGDEAGQLIDGEERLS